MENSEKIKLFEKELVYIRNPVIKDFAEKAVADMPDYFFGIPASSTGKYHPSYALGNGGLMRHVRAAVRIAVELFRMEEYNFSSDDKDLILVSLLVHDGRKSGNVQAKYTVAEHPKIQVFAMKDNDELSMLLPENQFQLVCDNVMMHMGQWNRSFNGMEFAPKPESKMQKFVHLCDYLASRKCLEMNFDVDLARD